MTCSRSAAQLFCLSAVFSLSKRATRSHWRKGVVKVPCRDTAVRVQLAIVGSGGEGRLLKPPLQDAELVRPASLIW